MEINERVRTAPNGQLSHLSPEDWAFVRSEDFKAWAGDWEHDAKSSLILDENGEPKVLYHGTTQDFDRFDFSKGGENTGITEYTDKKTGERVSSDSSRCMFFSDYEPQAVSYAFLRHYNELQEVRHKAQEVLSAIRSGQLGGVLNSYSSKQQFLDDVAALTPLVPSLKNLPPRISALSQEERYALAAPVVALRDEYAGYIHKMDNGGLSNQYDNVLRQGRAVESVIRDFDRLRHNDLMVEAEFGPFSRYSWTVTGATGNGEVSLFEDSGRMVFISKETGTLFLDTIDDATADRCKAIMRDTHAAAIRRFNNEVRNSGYGASTRIYRCFLKTERPFAHDYQGSAFPDYYKPNEKYPTAYIAARQVQHAVKNDHDAVIYENIRDPFEATTYGVFSPEQILIRDVKHGCRIDRELSMPEHMELLLLKDSGVSDTDARRVLDGDDVTVSSVYARRLVPGGAEPARVSCNMLLRNTNGKIVVVNPTTGIAVGTSKDITELARAFSAFEKCRKITRQHKAEPALAVHKIR